MIFVAATLRFKFYFIWPLAEASLTLGGLNFQARPGGALPAPAPRLPSPACLLPVPTHGAVCTTPTWPSAHCCPPPGEPTAAALEGAVGRPAPPSLPPNKLATAHLPQGWDEQGKVAAWGRCSNVDMYNVELQPSARVLPQYWNICTGVFLRR
jgi:hypothetical protein